MLEIGLREECYIYWKMLLLNNIKQKILTILKKMKIAKENWTLKMWEYLYFTTKDKYNALICLCINIAMWKDYNKEEWLWNNTPWSAHSLEKKDKKRLSDLGQLFWSKRSFFQPRQNKWNYSKCKFGSYENDRKITTALHF